MPMADNWRVLDLSTFEGTLRFDKRARKMQVIRGETGELTNHALSDINVMFIGLRVKLAEGFAYHLSNNDVVAIFCDWKGTPVSALYPWSNTHSRIAARQRAQASLSVPRQKNAWMRIVKAKILGQANALSRRNSDASTKLKQMSAAVKSGDPDNREGQAARLYWRYLFDNGEFIRRPGIREEGINGLLDYGYTVLRGYSARAVLSAGLNPTLGLFHKNRANAFALADDIIEPFRPAVDHYVASLEPGDAAVSKETRLAMLKTCSGPFGENEKTIPTVMTEFAQQYGQYVEGELKLLAVPVFTPRPEDAHED